MVANPLELIKTEISRIEETLRNLRISQHPFINQVSEYVLFSGGKRVRPLLCVLSAKTLNSEVSDFLYETSLLFEYLHVATLLHDDVVDSAEFRRGRKAARNLWGNQATILVGDYLYAKALRMASFLKNPEIMEVITETTLLMSEGEVLQLLHLDDTELTEEEYYEVIYRKTAVLMACACKVGALIASEDFEFSQNLYNFGLNLGMAFQVIDDLLDYTSSETGKDQGKDFLEGKVTLPVILALKNAENNHKEEILRLLKTKETKKKDFQRMYELLNQYKAFENTLEKGKEFVNKAKEQLKELPSSPFKEALNFLADYLLTRKK
ncbi:MAG: polyprenyl synthetase family protein [Caldimicrobium sp.]